MFLSLRIYALCFYLSISLQPICAGFAKGVQALEAKFTEAGYGLTLLSMDGAEKAKEFATKNEITLPVAYGLSEEQARSLGLYLSKSRPGTAEPALFSEPGLFVLNGKGQLAVVEMSNNPVVRPDLAGVLGGLQYMQANDYPLRGQD